MRHAMIISIILMLLVPAAAQAQEGPSKAGGASPQSVTRSVTIAAGPDIVWSTVRDFDAPSVWDPVITSTTLTHGKNDKPGAVRHMTTRSGGTIDDKLTAWSARKRRFTTTMKHSDLPVRAYRSTIRVESAPHNQTRVIWQVRFAPAGGAHAGHARRLITHRMQDALGHLKTMLGTAAARSTSTTSVEAGKPGAGG